MAKKVGLSVDHVVGAAAEIADSEGWGAVTLASVAARLDIRSPSLYAHVAGLEGLRRELALFAARTLAEVVEKAAGGWHGLEAIRSVAYAYRGFAARHPGLYIATQRATEPGPDRELEDARLRVIAPVLEALREAGVEGEAEQVHLTRALRSALHGFVSLERLGGFGMPADVDESFRRLVELLLSGVRGIGK